MDTKRLWQTALGELEVNLSKANFTTWFKDSFIVDLDPKGSVIIGVPNSFAKEWLETKYHKEIFQTLKKLEETIKEVVYKVATLPTEEEIKQEEKKKEVKDQKIISEDDLKVGQPKTNNLNSQYTFNTYIVGNSNRLAYATSMAVAANPGITYNPLFIYGGVGLGKTHLIQAIGNEILSKDPKKKVIYTSCEKFTNDYIKAISQGKMNDFKNTYRNIDILIVDDIQFLSNKEGTQEEFFHTFNTLHQTNRQIVITSDRVPKAIPGLEERLSSRFGWGMIADIQPPNFETRIAILEAKAAEKKYDLPTDVIEFIAQNIDSNIRELEGSLNRIITYCQLNGVEPSLDITSNILESFISSPKSANLSIEKIVKSVSKFFNLKIEDLMSPRRNKELVYPRQIIMYLLRYEMNMSFPRIAQELGGKDHTTIMYGVNKIGKAIAKDNSLKQDLTLIKEKLYMS